MSIATMGVNTITEMASGSSADQEKCAQLVMKKQRLHRGITICRSTLSGFKPFDR